MKWASESGPWSGSSTLAAGFTRKDDDLPARLKTEAAKVGPAKGLVSGIDKMIPEYYEVRVDTRGRSDRGDASPTRALIPSIQSLRRGPAACHGWRVRVPRPARRRLPAMTEKPE